MKIKTSELTGLPLDWAVATREGATWAVWRFKEYHQDGGMNYSTMWSQGGPIIEQENIQVSPARNWLTTQEELRWAAVVIDHKGDASHFAKGPTPLIAAMRCYVTSRLGDEVELPEELL